MLPIVPAGALTAPDGVTPLALPESYPVRLRVVFWIPSREPFAAHSGQSEVSDVQPFERAYLRGGAVVEHAMWLEFESSPTPAEMRRRLMPVWEGLAQAELGVVPRGVPTGQQVAPLTFGLTGVEADHT